MERTRWPIRPRACSAALLALLGFAGCALHYVPVGPPGARLNPGSGSITLEERGIRITIAPQRSVRTWTGALVLPVRVSIENRLEHPVTGFAPTDFVVLDAKGNQWSPVPAPAPPLGPFWGGFGVWHWGVWEPGAFDLYGWRLGGYWEPPPYEWYDLPPPLPDVPIEPKARLSGALFYPGDVEIPGPVLLKVRKVLDGVEVVWEFQFRIER